MSYAPPPEDSSGSASSGQTWQAAPQYSPDRRWYWDGVRWQPVVATGPLWSRPYASPEGRASAAVALVGLVVAGAGLFLVADGLLLIAALAAPASILDTIAAGLYLFAAWASASGLVAAAVAVPMWMHRTFRNLPALGETNLGWSPAWAVGGWFIPIGNLVIPYLVARELWARTVGTAAPGWPLLPVWWATVIAAVLLQRQIDLASGLGADVIGLVNDAVRLLAGVLLIVIVRTVTRVQRERHARVDAGA